MKEKMWLIIIFLLVCIAAWFSVDIINMKKQVKANEKAAAEVIIKSQKLMQQFKKEKKIQEQRNLKITNSVSSKKINKIIDYLVLIESEGDPKKIGDNGKAIGILQIHPIMVKDVNQIIGMKKYKLSDRLCPIKSRQMARIYLTHYTNKNWSVEKISRCWNGGPNGYKKYATIKYGKKFLSVWR